MKIGEIIKNIRRKAGKTRKEVVSELGITEAYLCSIENGKRNPEIPENGDGSLNIKKSLYFKILKYGLKKGDSEAESMILDWKISQLGVSNPLLKELIVDSINGNLSVESKKAILATYLGLKMQKSEPREIEVCSTG